MKKLLLFLLILPISLFSQELNADVQVNYEKLSIYHREKLQDFADVIEEYLNSNSFTGEYWEEDDRIKCSFIIFFTGAGGETKYSAQVVITSQRPIRYDYDSEVEGQSLMLKIMDNTWNFNYEPGQSTYFDINNFDPLASFLDFYAMVILGWDFDSYEPQGGTDFYEKAHNISIQGGSSRLSTGWDLTREQFNKRALLQDLLSAKFIQFRTDFADYHRNGLDIYSRNKDLAMKNIVKLINHLHKNETNVDARSVLLRTFFNAKSNEIVSYLEDYPDKEIFKKLKKIDPAHTAKYNEILDR